MFLSANCTDNVHPDAFYEKSAIFLTGGIFLLSNCHPDKLSGQQVWSCEWRRQVMKSLFYYFVGFPKLHFTPAVGEYHARSKYSYFVLNCTFSTKKSSKTYILEKRIYYIFSLQTRLYFKQKPSNYPGLCPTFCHMQPCKHNLIKKTFPQNDIRTGSPTF